jgi:Ca2+-binding RTX toxin-like protein
MQNPFQVKSSSSDVHFDHLNVHGSLDGNPQNDVQGMLVRDSSNISVTNSEFQQLWNALDHLNIDHLTVSGNTFHDLRTDGIRGGGSSDVTVSGNTFHDFHPIVGDHADAIQFWTTNTTASAHDIIVTGNLSYRGSGEVAQGVFLRDEVGNLPFGNVTIAGNAIIGGMYNGIAVIGGQNIAIHDNQVTGFTDMNSWIRLDNVSNATLANNAAHTLLINTTDTNVSVMGEVTVALASDNGAAALAQWLQAHSASAGGTSGGMDLVGTAGNDTLTGGAGDDTLEGGTGVDVLTGGAGNDLYVIGATATIVEQANGGTDTVQSSVSYAMANNVENLVLTGTTGAWASGNGLANRITGNSAADHLSGGAGADTLDGAAGNDVLTGGTGADRFVFGPSGGHDTISDFGLGGEHDALDLSALYGKGLTATLTETSAGVTVSFSSGDTILLQGQHVASLHATATGFTI